jgi:GNAT superfamily N-acetyltransferase
VDIAELALRAQVAWFGALAAGGFPHVSVGQGLAVSTGLASNTENGAVMPPSVLDSPSQVDAVLRWLRKRALPASVIVTQPVDPEATARLIGRRLEPENSGSVMGRLVTDRDADPDMARPLASGWHVTEATDTPDLRENHRVYTDDGWWDPGELDRYLQVAARLGFGPGRPIRHWTARHRDVPVGAASSFQFDDAVLLAHCCVAAPWRRRGIGTALTRAGLAAAAQRGARQAVLLPSPDGYHLHQALGFHLVPAHPNRWFYLR